MGLIPKESKKELIKLQMCTHEVALDKIIRQMHKRKCIVHASKPAVIKNGASANLYGDLRLLKWPNLRQNKH